MEYVPTVLQHYTIKKCKMQRCRDADIYVLYTPALDGSEWIALSFGRYDHGEDS
jgi:hypothetical protein